MADTMTNYGSKYYIREYVKDSNGNIIYRIINTPQGIIKKPIRDFDEEMRIYWKRRSEEKITNYWKDSTNLNNRLAREYKRAMADIEKEIGAFYSKYASKNGMTIREAKRFLSAYETGTFKENLDGIIKKYGNDPNNIMYVTRMKDLRKRKQIQRYEMLHANIETRLRDLGVLEVGELEKLMRNSYVKAYGDTARGIKGLIDVNKNFAITPNDRAIKTALQYNWSGSMFSDKLWNKSNTFINALKSQVTNNLIRGLNPREGVSEIAKFLSEKGMKNARFNAERIIRTEQMFIVNKAGLDSMTDAGMTHYRFNAHLDNRTSPQCEELAGEILPLDEAVIGSNYPPLHPFCRSSASPKIDPEKLKEGAKLEVPTEEPKLPFADGEPKRFMDLKKGAMWDDSKKIQDFRRKEREIDSLIAKNRKDLANGLINEKAYDKERLRLVGLKDQTIRDAGKWSSSTGNKFKTQAFNDFLAQQEGVGTPFDYSKFIKSPTIVRDEKLAKEYAKRCHCRSIYGMVKGNKQMKNDIFDNVQSAVNWVHSNPRIKYIHDKIGDQLENVTIGKATDWSGLFTKRYIGGGKHSNLITLDVDASLPRHFMLRNNFYDVGRDYTTNNIAQVYTHEYGHFVDYTMRDKKIKFWEEYAKRGKYPVVEVRKNISGYALYDDAEQFAEFFASIISDEYHPSRHPNPWVDDARNVFFELFDELYKK